MFIQYIVYSFINRHLVYFNLLVIVNNAAVNIVQISVQVPVFKCFNYIPRGGNAGSYGNLV